MAKVHAQLDPDELKKLKDLQDLMAKFRTQIEPIKQEFAASLQNLPFGNLLTLMKFEGKNKVKFDVKSLDEQFTVTVTRKVETEEPGQ